MTSKNLKVKFLFLQVVLILFTAANIFSQNITFSYKGNSRNCLIHLPASYDSSGTYPLVFNLHGFGSNSIQQEIYSGMDGIADTAGFIVAYPDAIDGMWDVIFSNSPIDDVGFINALTDSIMALYHIDTTRIYATGMSMGGFMTYRLGCELAERLAAIASVAGPTTDSVLISCDNSRMIPVMHIHGTDDNTVPYAGDTLFNHIDSTIQFFAGTNGCTAPEVYNLPDLSSTDACTLTSYYYCMGQDSAEVLFYKVNGGGHTWPGAVIPIGATNMDINGSEEIWKFFLKHQRKNTPTGIVAFSQTEPLRISLNPDGDGLTIFLPENTSQGEMQIEVFDISGKVFESFRLPWQNHVGINLRELSSGFYLVRVTFDDKLNLTASFILTPQR